MADTTGKNVTTRTLSLSLIHFACVGFSIVGLSTAAQGGDKNNNKERTGNNTLGIHDAERPRHSHADSNCTIKTDRNGRQYQFCNVSPPSQNRGSSIGARKNARGNFRETDKSIRAAPAPREGKPAGNTYSQPFTPKTPQSGPGSASRRTLPVPTPSNPTAQEARRPTVSSGSGLLPVRALIEQAEVPPREVTAYGVVAFSALPIGSEAGRYKFACEAFKATLISQSDLPPNTALSEQMITFWPIRDKKKAQSVRMDCDYLVSGYDLKTGLDAIHDADPKNTNLAERRGPFLIAWSPSESRYRGDSLVLIMDLSSIDEQESFMEVFRSWRHKITDDPAIWKRGFDVESVRRTVKEILDHYGESILKVVKPSS